MGVADVATAHEIIEILASGCLTTTFVWLQHHKAAQLHPLYDESHD